MKMKTTAAVTAALLCACSTMLAPGAAAIHVTHHSTEVEHCRPVGSLVAVRHGFEGAKEEEIDLRNQALGMGTGADTVLVTSRLLSPHVTAIAYRCQVSATTAAAP